MSDATLSYAPSVPHRRSIAGTVSLGLGTVADALFLAALFAYRFIAKPDLLAGLDSYHWKKMWFTIVPAWTGMALAIAAAGFAIRGLLIPGQARIRAAIGLGLALVVLALMFSPLSQV